MRFNVSDDIWCFLASEWQLLLLKTELEYFILFTNAIQDEAHEYTMW